MYEEINITVEQSSEAKVLIISVAARMAGMHPQTLRQYDRLGLVQPGRAGDIKRLKTICKIKHIKEKKKQTIKI